jgi:hypothetical protein
MRRSIPHRHPRELPLRRRAELREQRKRRAPPPVSPLIVPRRAAAQMLSVSISTMIRLEQAGTLTPLKLTEANNGQVFYRVSDLERLAQGGSHAD